MNVERLHVIAQAVRKEIHDLGLEKRLNQLVTALQQQVNEPQQPSHQTAVASARKALTEALAKAPSNSFTATWGQAVEEMGMRPLLGIALSDALDEIFSRNQITLSVAHTEVTNLTSQVVTLRQNLDQVLSTFKALRIGAEELSPGQCEVGVLIPRDYVESDLERFSKELHELNGIFESFTEVVTAESPSIKVRSISSSDLLVYVELGRKVCAILAGAIARVADLYKTLLEIRRLRKEMEEQGVPAKELSSVEQFAADKMNAGIEGIAVEVVANNYKGNDKHRKEELEISVKFSLRKMANRIDRGFKVDVRVGPIADAEKGAEEAENMKEARGEVVAIQESAKHLENLRLEGRPILALPESDKAEKKGGK